MTSLASVTQSISQSIIQNFLLLIRIGSAIRHLIIKSAPTPKFRQSSSPFPIRNWVQNEQSKTIDQQRLMQMINCDKQCYFKQGKRQKQKYDHYMKSLLQKIEKISKQKENEFYKERRRRICLISQVVSAIDLIQSNLKHYFSILGNQFPVQIKEKIDEVISLTYKVKLIQRKRSIETKNERENIIFKFEFLKPEVNPIRLQSYSDENFQSSSLEKKSTAITNNTTRPTSTTKSTRDTKNLKRITQRNDRYEIQQTHEDKEIRAQYLNVKKRQQIQVAKQKIQRCQTAKKVKETVKQFVNKKRKAGSSMLPLSPLEAKEPDPQNTQVILENKKQINQNLSIVAADKQLSINTSFSRVKNYQDSYKSHKKFKLAKDETAPSKQRFEQIFQSQKNPSRRKKGSQNIPMRDQIKLLPGRNYNSHQNFTSDVEKKETKIIKKIRNNQYQKKKKSSRRFSKQKEQISEELYTFYSKEINKKESKVLLIKAHPENLSQQKKYQLEAKQMKRQEKRQQQKIKRLQTEISSSQEAFKKKNQSNFWQEKSKHQLCQQLSKQEQNQIFKVSLEQINKIRQQFTKPKWELKPIFADNAENSVFFIEQGFLSHRQNVRFQSYLKKMKQNGGGMSIKEPFNLDSSSLQLKNQKVIGFERKYTFVTEDQWIKQKFKISPEAAEISQVGLELNVDSLL